MRVSMILRDGTGALVPLAGTTRIDSDPATGKVYYTPAATDLMALNSPYNLHWQVIDGAGTVVFFPNGAADRLAVVRP